MATSLSLALLLAAQVDLDAALRFSAPDRCEMAAPLDSIVERMTVIDPVTYEGLPPPPLAVPGFAAPIVPRFERTRTVEGNMDVREVNVSLALPGTWHGLRVTRLVRNFVEEGDGASVEIRFDETPGRVRMLLNRAGFRLGPVGMWRTINENDGVHITVIQSEGGASLVCAVG